MLKIVLTLLLQSLVLCLVATTSKEESSSSSETDSAEHTRGSHKKHWKYDDQDAWQSEFSDCSGKSQSPINIDTGDVFYDPTLVPLTLEGYDLTDHRPLRMENNGHTLLLELPSSMRITSGFGNVFLAAQLHFHWGSLEQPGSEHTIDDIHFPAEIHVVHYNSKYPDIKQASSQPDGLVVLGGFIGIGLQENENYERILALIKDISSEDSETEVPGFNVRHLLPNNLVKFYRYNGSLTTPPCFQTVNWTIFNETISVSRKQMAALEDTLKVGQNKLLSKNFRAPQRLYGRHVLSSFRELPSSATDGNPSSKGRSVNNPAGSDLELSRGDILAIAFGVLFAVTLFAFMLYACHQRRNSSRLGKSPRQNVIYQPATKEEA